MPDSRAPVYLIAGGRGAARRRGVVSAALGAAGTPKPSIAYVGAASADNAALRARVARMLKAAGAGTVRLAPLCGQSADIPRARRILEASDMVFMSGGDVDEGMRVLADSGMEGYLRALYRAGKPFFGVSAGSIMLARGWVRWTDPQDDRSAELFPCLGVAPLYCDTHGEADGWEELQVLQRLVPAGSASYGISSGAAIVVAPDGTVAALGGEVHRFYRRGKRVVSQESLFPG